MNQIRHMFSVFVLSGIVGIVRVYQKTLSPDHGPLVALFPFGVCRYQPTCSQYTIESIEKYGWRGVLMGMRQILRCHPFASV